MKKLFSPGILMVLCLAFSVSCSRPVSGHLILLETTDVHGMLMPYDYTEGEIRTGSLASLAGYLLDQQINKKELVLLDNGDILQGQPTEYYYNYIDTLSDHFNSLVMNWLRYDAATVGNHDIEAGHSVYDRVRKEYRFPLLAANAIDIRTGKPYFEPYSIIRRNGLKIAVLGLVTASIPNWLPPELYSGIEFRDMTETASEWMEVIRKEDPDIVVGLFHSGWDDNYLNRKQGGNNSENSSASVAYHIPGFDIIFTGHDHAPANEKFVNISGDTVLILNAGSRAEKVARADVIIEREKGSDTRRVFCKGSLVDLTEIKPDKRYLSEFRANDSIVKGFVNNEIGFCDSTFSSRESYFGPSAFTGLIHSLQLKISGADISFAAPLSFDTEIRKGTIKVGDMFRLYRFENMLYTMKLTGEEVDRYLEYSYNGWISTVDGKNGHLLKFRTGSDGKPALSGNRARLKYPSYNFDSASGINYIVDAGKQEGNRITVTGFSDGRPFSFDSVYMVALNSYRGSGGGGHMTEGIGFSREELAERLVRSTDRDLRYYMIKAIEGEKKLTPFTDNNWKIIPENAVKRAKTIDYHLLFGPE